MKGMSQWLGSSTTARRAPGCDGHRPGGHGAGARAAPAVREKGGPRRVGGTRGDLAVNLLKEAEVSGDVRLLDDAVELC
ncbi:hypothetical protein, partial [Streptomyces lavendulocolor]|uniref:hypothetical protein n=1 Tax=Streptomyces lavendulocolor TaxID=67316 RepID=UPI0033D0654E